MESFDGLKRLRKAIREAQAMTVGQMPKEPQTAHLEAPRPRARYFTVYKVLGGVERPVAFGLHSWDARVFMAAMRLRMVRANGPNEDGRPYFEATTYRTREEI